jgi:hypothetical protein
MTLLRVKVFPNTNVYLKQQPHILTQNVIASLNVIVVQISNLLNK